MHVVAVVNSVQGDDVHVTVVGTGDQVTTEDVLNSAAEPGGATSRAVVVVVVVVVMVKREKQPTKKDKG